MKLEKATVHVGTGFSFRTLHITDSHLALCNENDPEKQRALSVRRQELFDRGVPGQCRRRFEDYLAYAKQQGETVLMTGDIIDFLSDGNRAYLKKALEGVDYIYAAGNHDFCHYPGLEIDDDDVKRANMKEAAPYFPHDNLIFSSQTRFGVNFVSIDNTYYRTTAGQHDLFMAEAAKGMPIVLLMHNPLYSKELADAILKTDKVAWLAGCPQSLLDTYPGDYGKAHAPDAETLSLIEDIRHCELVKAIVTGHVHASYVFPFSNTATQYVTGGTYLEEVVEFEFV